MQTHPNLRIIFTVICSGITALLLQAQNLPNVLVDGVSGDGECTVIINGADTSQILASRNPDITYRSADGGQTWTQITVSQFSTQFLIGDVALATDTAGHYYFQSLDGQYLFRQFRSDDYGQTWVSETSFGDIGWIEDKNWLVCDRVNGSPYNGRLYCAWTRRSNGPNDPGYIFVNHSADMGQSWVPRDTLDAHAPVPAPVPPIGTGLAVGPGGEIGVSWGGGIPNQIRYQSSTDGGVNWQPNPVVVDFNVQPSYDYFDYINHAISFSAQFTSLACDVSGGAYNGNRYCVWSDVRNGVNNADIFLARSVDGGVTWNTQRINDDTTTRNQVLPTVAVDPLTGWVYVAYLDARLNKDALDDSLHYYLAWSVDGGQTFTNTRVSQQISTQQYIHSDYMGLDVNNGKVCLFWVGGTVTAAWSSCFTYTDLLPLSVDETNHASGLLLYPAVPNPAVDFSTFDFQLSEPSSVTMIITDINGRTIAEPISNANYEAGRHQYKVMHDELNLSAGVYIATLTSPLGVESRKFIVSE